MKTGPRLSAIIVTGLATALLSMRGARAKTVTIDWKRVSLASGYQIEIRRDGSTENKMELSGDQTHWTGDLKPGNYEYRIRTKDRLERWGEWSAPLELIVLPDPPVSRPTAPVEFHGKTGQLKVSWHEVPGISRYRVRLFRSDDGALVDTRTVDQTQETFKKLEPGRFRWQVSGIVAVKRDPDAAPAPSDSPPDELETKPSPLQEVTLSRLPLARPALRSPIGPSVPTQGKVRFAWDPVEGAESYQIRLSGAAGRELQFSSRTPSLTVRLSRPGRYTWKVRALASEIEGPESTAGFVLAREPRLGIGSGYVALSTMIAPYNYDVVSPSQGYDVSTHAMSSSIRLSGEYFVQDRWSVGGTFSSTFIDFSGVNVTANSAEISIKRMIPLSETDHAWVLLPRFGIEARQYIQVYPDLTSGSGSSAGISGVRSIYAAGPQIGFDLRKELTSRLSLGGKATYFLPALLGGGPASGARIAGFDAYRNLSVGLQGLYWLDRRWAMGAGGFLDYRSISYEAPGQGSPDQIRADAAYFFGSLIYSFGR